MERVIVYQSQAEAELDKLIWSGDGTFFKVGIFCLSWVTVFCALNRVYDARFMRNFSRKNYFSSTVMLWIFGIISFPTTYGICMLLNKLLLYI
jgi:hypothetical protein